MKTWEKTLLGFFVCLFCAGFYILGDGLGFRRGYDAGTNAVPNRTYAKGIMGHGIWTNGQSIVKDGVVIGGEIHDSPSPLIPAESCILPDPNTSCDVHTTVLEKLPAPEIPVGMELVPIRMDVPILAPGYAFLKADGKEINGFSVAATGPGPTAMLMVKDEQAAMLRQAKSLVIRVRK